MEPAPQRRISPAVIVGWLLTAPGFLMLAGMIAQGSGLLDRAGCQLNFATGSASCPPGLLGGLMSVLQVAALIAYVSLVILVGAVPIAWSLIYPVARWHRRRRA